MASTFPLVQPDDIVAARGLLRGVISVTPLLHSRVLSELAGGPVYLKCENLQRTGSFKIRGAYVRIARLSDAERARGVVAASAGNHAQGVALAAALLGAQATVMMPERAPLPKVEATRAYGAAVILHGVSVEDALEEALRFSERTGAVFIHPFDHADIVAGQGTVGLEIIEQCPGMRTILIPVGGGGFAAGVTVAVHSLDPDVRVVGVQAEAVPGLAASFAAGQPVRVVGTPTMADGIAVQRPGDIPFAILSAGLDRVVAVSEAALARGLLLCLERAKQVVEPSGAAGVAALLAEPGMFEPPVVVVLSGGNIDPLLLSKLLRNGLSAAGRFLGFRCRVPDYPGSLATLLGLLADLGANVLEVSHERLAPSLRVDEVEVVLQVETRGPEHCEHVKEGLRAAGYDLVFSLPAQANGPTWPDGPSTGTAPATPGCDHARGQHSVASVQHSSHESSASASHGSRPATLGELKASGHLYRTVKQEIRENLIAQMRAGQDRFPGIVGFDQSVLPHVERSLIAGHDIILLGERGQGKTRLIRTLASLLDEWSPAVRGCEINDHPYAPVCARCLRLQAEQGDDLEVVWRHRDDRYGEKLATPDTSVGDLIGDIDPVKVAEGRTLGDPETIHFGMVPRTNRGIFCLNELPDLAERIQVALLNVLEERDIGVRGYSLRLPLDIVVVASANPEDYTNRGRIITPLKDRFGAEIRTHYPLSLGDELTLISQEAAVVWDGRDAGAELPVHLIEVIARFTRLVRESPAVDSRSGVSARLAIAAAESAAAAAVRRTALLAEAAEDVPVARVGDLPGIVATLRGKVEFEVSEEGREEEILAHLLRRAIAETFRGRLGGADLSGVLAKFADGATIESGELVSATELLRRTGEVPGLAKIMARLGMAGRESFGEAAAAIEFVLEGLYLTRKISKDTSDGTATYRS